MFTLTLTAAAAFAAGYIARYRRPMSALLGWAEDQTRDRPVRFWAAQPVLAVAIAVIFAIRPRHTLANIRAARKDAPCVSPPAYDPDWAAKRRTAARPDDTTGGA